jgi:hypothetical protein
MRQPFDGVTPGLQLQFADFLDGTILLECMKRGADKIMDIHLHNQSYGSTASNY